MAFKVDIFTLCKNVTKENGMFQIEGATDLLFAPNNDLPITLGDGFIFIKLRCETGIDNPENGIVELTSQVNKKIVEKFIIDDIPKPSKFLFDTFTCPIKISLADIIIPAFGKYNVSLQINGRFLVEIPIYIIRPVSLN